MTTIILRASKGSALTNTEIDANFTNLNTDKAERVSPTLVTPVLGTPVSVTLTNATGLPVATGISGLASGIANFLATPTSANLAAALTDETGTGAAVFATSPVLVTPALGTPASATLTNATGLPVATGISGLASGIANFLATPTSANLAAALTDETGTGAAVFATSPVLVTPALGTPSSLTGTNITGTAAGFTAGTVTTNANLTGHITSIGNATVLGSFTSSQLATALTDETGTGAAVFATSPVLVTPALGTPTSAILTNATGLPLTSGITGTLAVANGGTGVTTSTGTGDTVLSTSPTLVTPALGTPASGVMTNVTGTAAGLTAGTVTTNANLTGVVTSTGNATAIADAALSIAKTSGLQAALDLKQNLSAKDAANGYAGLDASSKINPSQLPALAITDTFVVASQAAQIAVTAEVGDVVVRTDLNKSFILQTSPASTFANWQELLTPTDVVGSVFGRTGVVTAQSGDYTAAQVGAPAGSGNSTGTNTGDQTNISGNAATVTTNANLTGHITSTGNATVLGSFTSSQLSAALTDETGTGAAVFATSPVLVTPALGTPSSLTGTNITGIPLTTAVTGILPVTNGGTGTNIPAIVAGTNVTVTGTWPNQTINSTGTVTSVSASVPAFLSVSGSPITTSGTLAITLSGTALPVANGGTGTTTPSIVAGTNVTVTGTWPNQTINASGSGDVVGPASATDNAIARFNLATGKLIKNSVVTVSDTGAIIAPATGSIIPFYWNDPGSFPSASTYHGAIAHAHSTAAMYFAHGGVWTMLIKDGGPLGTPSSGTVTNLTGTAAGLTAGTVTTNANLTGAVVSVGNAAALGSFSSSQLLNALTDETGTGYAVFATSPVLITPALGTPSALVGTNITGIPLSSAVTGTLAVANGGTGTASPNIVAGTNVTVTGTWPNQTINSSGRPIAESLTTVSSVYTITSGSNALAVSPMTITSGSSITAPTGSALLILT